MSGLPITIDDTSPLIDYQPPAAWVQQNSDTDVIGHKYVYSGFRFTNLRWNPVGITRIHLLRHNSLEQPRRSRSMGPRSPYMEANETIMAISRLTLTVQLRLLVALLLLPACIKHRSLPLLPYDKGCTSWPLWILNIRSWILILFVNLFLVSRIPWIYVLSRLPGLQISAHSRVDLWISR